jgi:predicted ATPase/DNA-binding SARP family transcriptional activator
MGRCSVLEFRVLGPLEVARDGADVPISAPKLRTVLLALLIAANRVVPLDHLIDAVWGDDIPASARKLVQVYISQLRGALGPDAIETLPQAYRITVGSNSLDSARFERLRDDASRALGDANPELALALARRALGLWRGPALVDVAYEPFASAEAARLDELRLDCSEDALDAELALGRHEEVVPGLRRFCAEHPLRERARIRLALALYRCSRQSEALEVLAEGRRLMVAELGVEPGREHAELERSILNHDEGLDLPTTGPAGSRHLPASSSSLVGRDAELTALQVLVARGDVRLVTISGAGGSGKTRVALELARAANPVFANGAAFVELASVPDATLVMGTIARSLGVPEAPDQSPAAALARWAQGLDMLLVLDNFEHLVEAGPDLARLLEETSRLTVVVTSRRVLHLAGEHVYPLSPLPLADAVQLFCARAAARDGSISQDARETEDPSTLSAIEAVCRRLDCLPLAVELAAARTSTLTPRLLLERLSARVAALGIGPRDAPARQQTLHDTLRWSTDLLSAEERRVLSCLSTFVGGSSIEAAEEVCGTDLERLSALIDSSLLQRTAANGQVRLSMLETVREYAGELLGDDQVTAESRHAAYFRNLIEDVAGSGPASQAQKLEVLDADIANLRAAIDRAESVGDDDTALSIATGLYRFFYLRSLFREGRDRISGPLQRGAGNPPTQALALRALAGFHFLLGELDEARAAALRGIDVGTAAGADYPVMACHTVLSHVAREREDFAEAKSHLEQSSALATRLGLRDDVMVANTNLGELALALGNLEEARSRWELSLSFYDEDDESSTFALLGLGSVAVRQGDLMTAHGHFSRARALSERAGWLHNTTMALIGLAGVASDQGDHVEAAQLLGRAVALLEATGGELVMADEAIYQRVHRAALAHLGQDQLDALLLAGGST